MAGRKRIERILPVAGTSGSLAGSGAFRKKRPERNMAMTAFHLAVEPGDPEEVPDTGPDVIPEKQPETIPVPDREPLSPDEPEQVPPLPVPEHPSPGPETPGRPFMTGRQPSSSDGACSGRERSVCTGSRRSGSLRASERFSRLGSERLWPAASRSLADRGSSYCLHLLRTPQLSRSGFVSAIIPNVFRPAWLSLWLRAAFPSRPLPLPPLRRSRSRWPCGSSRPRFPSDARCR